MNDYSDGYFRAGIVRGQLAGFEQAAILDVFAAEVDEVIGRINDGKEAARNATRKGRDMGHLQWVACEWRTLEVLHAAGGNHSARTS